jgi:chromosome segregation ATPase
MARVLVVAFFILVGMGIYLFTVNQKLEAAQIQVESITKDRDQWKTRMTQYQSEGKAQKTELDQCNTAKTDLQTQLDTFNAAMAKKGPAKK